MLAEIQWRPIRDVAYSEKAEMPVSTVMNADGQRSVVSRYGDDVWDFYPYIPQDNIQPSKKQFSWKIKLPDGRLLTDPEHRKLLESAKDFTWVSYMNPAEGRRRPTALTVVGNRAQLVHLLRWMVSQGLKQFADMNGRLLEYVAVARMSLRTGQRTEVSSDTLGRQLRFVEGLFLQREKLTDALQKHPWPLESACSLAEHKQDSSHLRPKTEVIPDFVVTKLIGSALQYIRERAPSLLDALELGHAAAHKAVQRGASYDTQSRARSDAARQAGYSSPREVASEAIRLRTACYIIIGLFSGIRDSEMISLEEGCIRQETTSDGITTLYWMHGTIYKTGKRSKKWLVPEIVHETVLVLTRLTAPLRNQMRHRIEELRGLLNHADATRRTHAEKKLTLLQRQANKLFLTMGRGTKDGCPSALAGTIATKNLKSYCAELGVNDIDSKPYRLYPHQFRRTYARLIARSELGDLLYLRDHFGHWSIDMTLYYADGAADEYEANVELFEMVAKEKLARQNEVVREYLTTTEPIANGNHWLKEWRRSVHTAKNKEALITEYAGMITLNGTGHSWCLGNARGTGCGGLCVLQAKMCVDCNYGVIGQEHRAVWEGIRDQQLEAIALDDMGPGGRARAEEILDKAHTVLRRLDGQGTTT